MFYYTSYLDIFLGPIFIFIFYKIIILISRKYYSNDEFLQKKLIQGFWVKVLAAILYVLLIQFYYGGGDSFMYFGYGRVMNEAIRNDSSNINFLFSGDKPFYDYLQSATINEFEMATGYMASLSNQIISRFSCVFGFFCFQNYTVVSLFFAVLSYIGIWKMVLVFYKIFPGYKKQISFSFLFLPSFIFWGSGILKESVCLFSLGLIIKGFYNLFYFKNTNWRDIIGALIGCFLLISIKDYIFYAFIGSFIVLLYRHYIRNTSLFTKLFIYLIVILIVTIGFKTLLDSIENDRESLLKTDAFFEQTKSFRDNYEDLGGAFVDIGDFDPTPLGVAKKIPQIFITVFFRPFPWEARSIVLFISMLESLFFLILIIRALLITKILGFFTIIFKNPVILTSFVFSLLLSIVIGLTTYNFGAIIRYKIPCMPFLCMVLLFINSNIKINEATIDKP